MAPESGSAWTPRVNSPEVGYLNVRSRPSTAGEIVATAPHDSAVTPLEPEETVRAKVGQYGQWLHVRLAGGRVGYVAAWYLVLPEPAPGTGEEPTTRVWVNSPDAGYLNIRTAPSIAGGLITQALHATSLPALEPEPDVRAKVGRYGEWLNVGLADGREGYGFAYYLSLTGTPGGDSSLEPPAEDQITVTSDLTGTQRQVALAWNRLGGLLQTLADQMGIAPGVAVAVLTVESGGRAFGPDGRMIIRFENHIFHDQWGQHHPEVFARHFAFNPDHRWKDHRWRPATDQPWRGFHGDQGSEWEVLGFARTIDDTAARLCIAMGGPQIMGFNYAAVGYTTVRQMFDDFAASERHQVVGFFNFVRSRGEKAVRTLQALDFEGFAAFYNGPGQATAYGSLIRQTYEAYRRLRTISFGAPKAPPGAAPAPWVEVDDLARILGIDPQTIAALQAEGIHSFASLAALDVAHLQGLLGSQAGQASFVETWPAQARLAAWGDWQALEALQAQLE
jgi:predicted flap endonuclease-1-like 5' DNA nuclease